MSVPVLRMSLIRRLSSRTAVARIRASMRSFSSPGAAAASHVISDRNSGVIGMGQTGYFSRSCSA